MKRSSRLLAGLVLLLAGPAWAAPIAVDIDRNVNLAIGTRTFGPFNVPDDLSRCTLSLDRTNWTNPDAKLRAWFDISIDGGPFEFWLGMTAQGGQAGTTTSMSRPLPEGTNRQIRGGYELSGSRFRTTVSARCE